ncbi:hypothetical protein JCM8115_000466 [Rhodotorula mucilaginosa]|uniref:Ribosome maturation protein SDO1/SBDS N-terminal domain-containing protein n=1 Tax=Rhodotorula mucilaginosa TaxID=5537 RepID=A0A9P7B930_RHOMI|nr:hypothetical protein C6P46_000958 [Rhodotorula mucilaginosa]
MKSFHKAVYKPDSMSTDEYIVIVGDVAAAEKWKGGDRSIPLVNVVDSFDVFHTGQGSQGLLARPSKQDLDTIFGTTNEDAIVEQILTKGTIKTSEMPHGWTSRNDQKSGGYQVSTGAASLGHGGR